MTATLYTLPASHPAYAARLMLEHKGIPYRRVDLLPALHKPLLRLLGFQGTTVPALRLNGRAIQESRAIARALEVERPDPPLLPRDPAQRARVEEAERFGDEELQPVVRRLALWAIRRDLACVRGFLEDARLPVPPALAARTAGPLIAASARINGVSEERERADLAALPGLLERVDRYVEEGTIGGTEPNAADFQIAPSVRLLMCLDDLRPLIDGRPAAELALRVAPRFPGRVSSVLRDDERALLSR